MTRNNALWNCKNPYQGSNKRVLTVCSAGLLRSPTIASFLIKNKDYNCRACGIHDYALVPIDDVLVTWADTIICAEDYIKEFVEDKFKDILEHRKVISFQLQDRFYYQDPELVDLINDKVNELDI